MKSWHDYFCEARAADRRLRRGYRKSGGCECDDCFPNYEALSDAYWAKREAMKAARDRFSEAYLAKRRARQG